MRRLISDEVPVVADSRQNERGAVAVLTAMCMVGLLLVVALVVNMGIGYNEKAQLQNGADAAALAVAGACGVRMNTSPCTPGMNDPVLNAIANNLANGNSNDGHSGVTLVIGDGQVTATTSTLDGGSPTISMPISGANVGVQATASAAWGGVKSGTPVLPLTFGACELNPMDGVDRVVVVHGSGKCASWNSSSGLNMPGGFGWLAVGSGCQTLITINDPWVDSKTGASIPGGCKGLFTSALIGQTVLLPIFGFADGTGANGTYKIIGWGVFVVEGFNFPSATVNWPTGKGTKGLFGHFVTQLTYEQGFTYGGPSVFGSVTSWLTK